MISTLCEVLQPVVPMLSVFFFVMVVFNALLGPGYYLRMLSNVWFKPVSEVPDRAHSRHPR